MASIPNRKLNDGRSIPLLGYGLGTANYKKPGSTTFDQQVVDYTLTAVQVGFTHLDGAEAYGNEEELGAAIKAAGVPREQLFVTTKYSPRATGTIEEAFARSLEKLGLDYVDLYLIHAPYWPGVDDAALQARWAELEAIQASGRARSIGLSNFLQDHVAAVLKTAKVVPAINQIEYHPYLQHGDIVAFHRKHNIALAAYGPLTALLRGAPGPLDAVYAQLAAKYNVSTGAVALRWVLDQDIVTLTTSSSEKRLQGYLQDTAAFHLTADEVAEISRVGLQKHYRGFWKPHFGGDEDRR